MATTFVESGNAGSSADANSYATGTVTAAENDWVVLGVCIAAATKPSFTGASGSALGAMTKVGATVSNPGTSPDLGLAVYKAKVGAGGISEAITVTLSGTAARACLMPVVVSGGHATDIIQGTNYDDTQGADTTNSLTNTIAAAFQTGGSVLVFAACHSSGYGNSFEGGYTVGTRVESGEALESGAAWLPGTQDLSVVVTDGNSNNSAMVTFAMEIATAAAAGSALPLVNAQMLTSR